MRQNPTAIGTRENLPTLGIGCAILRALRELAATVNVTGGMSTTEASLSMNDTERAGIERVAENLLNHDREVAVGISALAAEGYDTGLLLELVTAYARLPEAKQKFEFRTDRSGRPEDFTLRVRRR